MTVLDSTVLVTGAKRGIGLAFAKAFPARGAPRIHAGGRDPSGVTTPGAVPLKLDITSAQDVQAVARDAGDVTIVVNNAGIAATDGFLHQGLSAAPRGVPDGALEGASPMWAGTIPGQETLRLTAATELKRRSPAARR